VSRERIAEVRARLEKADVPWWLYDLIDALDGALDETERLWAEAIDEVERLGAEVERLKANAGVLDATLREPLLETLRERDKALAEVESLRALLRELLDEIYTPRSDGEMVSDELYARVRAALGTGEQVER